MSFSQDIKNEILHRHITRPCCLQAAAYAVACFGKYFDDRGVVLQTENEGVAMFALRSYAQCGITGAVSKKDRSTGPLYEFAVKDSAQVVKMLALFGHTGRETALRINAAQFKCQECTKAFISTAFLCCGTASDPEKEYSIEFHSGRHILSRQLEAMLAELEFYPHSSQRNGAVTVYVKAVDSIEDLLTYMGAGKAAMRIMDRQAWCGVRNKTNRISNCDTANMSKSVRASVQVQRAVRILQDGGVLETLPQPLLQAARLRLAFPDLPLAQLAQKLDPPISKSGLSHRFQLLIQEADAFSAKKETADARDTSHQ